MNDTQCLIVLVILLICNAIYSWLSGMLGKHKGEVGLLIMLSSIVSLIELGLIYLIFWISEHVIIV